MSKNFRLFPPGKQPARPGVKEPFSRNNTLFLTGATGCVGSRLLPELQRAGPGVPDGQHSRRCFAPRISYYLRVGKDRM
jgi:hypothetical protein